MHVTEVDITFVKPKDGLVAFASVVLDDQIFLSGIAIHQKAGRLRPPADLPEPEGRGHTVQPLLSDSQADRAPYRGGNLRKAEGCHEQARCWTRSF
jgi:hypothetical protein